ncbi:MAG: epoxyqueuosine reductase QueH [Desulfobacterales bacterium]|nr:epoxyqueuosine reductase QueH [Desulfobacterales bacterium]
MKLLLHICCAPCAIYPVKTLRNIDFEIRGFFYRSNIHPYQECLKRENTLKDYAKNERLEVIYQEAYDIEHFLQNVAFRESNRCIFRYHDRLQETAHIAKKENFDYFSTTLLYSKFQKHDAIKSIGESIGNDAGIPFYYLDFRDGWKEGIDESKQQGMYRQQYCGCIYSEKERYYK